jgi:hypothetical protein
MGTSAHRDPRPGNKYDSLQIKVTKRLSHGLQGTGAYTWGQGFNRAARQDFFNPASAAWALQNYPPPSADIQYDLHGPESQLPAKGSQCGE